MPVITRNQRWPNSRAPYVIATAAGGGPGGATWAQNIESWMQEINRLIGFELLVPKTSNDSHYIKLEYGGGKTDRIGWFSDQAEKFCRSRERFEAQHEALHALGFAHEEIHPDFPWDMEDPKEPANLEDKSYTWKGKLKRRWNKCLYEEISRENNGSVGADGKIRDIMLGRRNADYEFFGACDYDSVMMYSWFPEVVTRANNEATRIELKLKLEKPLLDPVYEAKIARFRIKYRSGKAGANQYLSNLDVSALQSMYAAPAAPALATPVSVLRLQHRLLVPANQAPAANAPGKLFEVPVVPAATLQARLRSVIKAHSTTALSPGVRLYVAGPDNDQLVAATRAALSDAEWYAESNAYRYKLKVSAVVTADANVKILLYKEA